jgi:AraC-like DNA-binding protein
MVVVIGCAGDECRTRQEPRPRWVWLGLGHAVPLLCIGAVLGLTKSEIPQHRPHDADFVPKRDLLQRRCGLRNLPFAVALAAPDVRLGGLAPWRIRRLQAFVEEHLSQSIHIADLSGAVGLSVPHFSRAFGLSFGEPPHLYVIQRRLDRARHLMLTSDMALSELAVACGFNDQAHFCRLFRQHTGRTPAAWRREWRDAIRANGSSSPLPPIAAVVADPGVESRRSAAA